MAGCCPTRGESPTGSGAAAEAASPDAPINDSKPRSSSGVALMEMVTVPMIGSDPSVPACRLSSGVADEPFSARAEWREPSPSVDPDDPFRE